MTSSTSKSLRTGVPLVRPPKPSCSSPSPEVANRKLEIVSTGTPTSTETLPNGATSVLPTPKALSMSWMTGGYVDAPPTELPS